MPLANPADGVWFLEVGTAGLDLPDDEPRNFYLVCTHMDDSGDGAAMLFHHRQYGMPNDLDIRRKANDWFNECYQWMKRQRDLEIDVLLWSGAPRPFTVAYSWRPGTSHSFYPAGFAKNEDTDTLVQRLLWNLCSVWREWIAWAATQGVPTSPEIGGATYCDDPGWIMDETADGEQEEPEEAP